MDDKSPDRSNLPSSFPSTVMFVDTGERRYPIPGTTEWYCWQDEDGKVHGPQSVAKIPQGAGEWASDPDRYAIYDMTVISGKLGVN